MHWLQHFQPPVTAAVEVLAGVQLLHQRPLHMSCQLHYYGPSDSSVAQPHQQTEVLLLRSLCQGLSRPQLHWERAVLQPLLQLVQHWLVLRLGWQPSAPTQLMPCRRPSSSWPLSCHPAPHQAHPFASPSAHH